MRRLTSKLALAGAGFFALGCPIYDYEDCAQHRDLCGDGFACDVRSGQCVRISRSGSRAQSCESPEECDEFETCTDDGECRPGSCAIHGCVEGFRCEIVDDQHRCVAADSPPESSQADAG